jgi:hypothetical protein
VLVSLVLNIVIWVILVAPALWISGRLIAGKAKAKFTDALWIVALGTVIFYFTYFAIVSFFADVFGAGLVAALISSLVLLIIWLALVKHFFDCGWLKALAISIVAVVVAIVIWFIIGFILALLNIDISWFTNLGQITNI